MHEKAPIIQLGTFNRYSNGTLTRTRSTDTSEHQPMMLTRADLARELQLSLRTIRRMLERGELPRPQKFGRQLRWYRPMIIEWLNRDAIQPRRGDCDSNSSASDHNIA